MGCINNIKIKDKKYTSVITISPLIHDIKEKRMSQPLNQHIYSKKIIEDNSQTVISQGKEDIIENNPLPFVKIKPKRKSYKY